MNLDLGLLAGFSLDESTQDSLQNMVDALFKLPRGESNFTVLLPEPELKLPRKYPIPKEKPETRWEKFAREKGIEKRKRERLVFDEITQTWKPRFGYGRAIGTGNSTPPIMELKQSDPADVDPFERAADERKMKKLKQKQHELKNLERAKGEKEKPVHSLKSNIEKNKKVLQTVQVSTRSYGRFDEKVRNEPTRKVEDRRRRFEPNVGDATSEKTRLLKILKRMSS